MACDPNNPLENPWVLSAIIYIIACVFYPPLLGVVGAFAPYLAFKALGLVLSIGLPDDET